MAWSSDVLDWLPKSYSRAGRADLASASSASPSASALLAAALSHGDRITPVDDPLSFFMSGLSGTGMSHGLPETAAALGGEPGIGDDGCEVLGGSCPRGSLEEQMQLQAGLLHDLVWHVCLGWRCASWCGG